MVHGDFILNEFAGGVNFSSECLGGPASLSIHFEASDNFNLMIRKA